MIIAIPSRIVQENISFNPKLNDQDIFKMKNIATWMAHSAKCIIE